jgi:cytoskeletal protein CcmA (bactofilin family)
MFTGDISANDISGTNLDLTGDFNVTGTSVFTGDISANDISGANLDLTGDFNVTGTSVFTGDISANDISGTNLDLTGDFNVTGTSMFTGDISANDISGANLDLTGSLNANNIVAVGDISGATFRGNDAFSDTENLAPANYFSNGGGVLEIDDTFNGYTIFQVVNCLKEFGFLQ